MRNCVLTTSPPDERRKFGELVYKLRSERGWTQRELASKMGLSPGTLASHWESGRQLPSLLAAVRLARAFGISMDELTREIK